MSRVPTLARVLLGLTFVVFGLDGLLQFFPMPPMPEPARQVIAVLMGYRLFYAVKALEITSGLLLLTNRYSTLALCLLAPILFNIVWFDAALDPASLPVAVVLVGLELYLIWRQWDRFSALTARVA